ncbi:ATP-binding protein, partial [Candidatus Woesearchaeota archaeon CG08_land_8_20_14_0_20_43_7]
GLSEEHQEGYSSLGMKLVKTLVEQIDGTLEIVSKKGMHTIIVFPLPKD